MKVLSMFIYHMHFSIKKLLIFILFNISQMFSNLYKFYSQVVNVKQIKNILISNTVWKLSFIYDVWIYSNKYKLKS